MSQENKDLPLKICCQECNTPIEITITRDHYMLVPISFYGVIEKIFKNVNGIWICETCNKKKIKND